MRLPAASGVKIGVKSGVKVVCRTFRTFADNAAARHDGMLTVSSLPAHLHQKILG